MLEKLSNRPNSEFGPREPYQNKMSLIKLRHARVGLPFIGLILFSLLLLSFDVSADSTHEDISDSEIMLQNSRPPLPAGAVYFDSPIATYTTFEGGIQVAMGGVSLYDEGERLNEADGLTGSFPVTLQACSNGTDPIIHAAYLQWYQRWRGADTDPTFDPDININVNGALFGNDVPITEAWWARISEKNNGTRTWVRRNAMADITMAPWVSGVNSISFSGLTSPIGNGKVNNETYGIGVHVFYECSDFPKVQTTFSTGLDWFYYANTEEYAGIYSDLTCFEFPTAPQNVNVSIDALLGGQASPQNAAVLRGAEIWYLTGGINDTMPVENDPTQPVGVIAENQNQRSQVGTGQMAIWKSNLGREWDAYSNYAPESNHNIEVQQGDTWICFQAKSTPQNPGEAGNDRGVSGDLFSVAFTIPFETENDLGDLPEDTTPGYKTTLANGGPIHPIIPELQIGAVIDNELDGQPAENADGDDNAGNPDDEDGVVLPDPQPGQPNNFEVTASNTTGQDAFLYGFIDWNADGDFDDADESIRSMIPSGSVDLTMTIVFTPAEIAENVGFGARFRLSTDANLGPDGPATNGEVEDYILSYLPPPPEVDWGDLPDIDPGFSRGNYHTDSDGPTAGPSHPIIMGLQIGDKIDAELDGQPSGQANADDLNPAGFDDEDGAVFSLPPIPNAPNLVMITVSNTTGKEAYLYGFIDWNADGTFDDANETISTTIPTGTSDEAITLTFTPITITARVDFGARFRLSTEANLGPNGPAVNGEVEDYILSYPGPIVSIVYDRGDLPEPAYTTTLSHSPVSGPSHQIVEGLHLGALIDAEDDGQPSDVAEGDDDDAGIAVISFNPFITTTATDGDDEDGVVLPTKVVVGTTANFTVMAVNERLDNADAFLVGFVDWNGDGDFDDHNETQRQTVPRQDGAQTFIFSFEVPSTTKISRDPNIKNLGVRFRLSTTPNLAAVDNQGDPIPFGEVEDYLISAVAYDRGDLPEPKYKTMIDPSSELVGPSHLIVPGLHLGAVVDAEGDGQPHHFANGDDGFITSPIDDEDGVQLPRLIEIEKTADFLVTAVNTRGVPAYIYAFVDWNGDGDFKDTNESQTQFVESTLAADPQSFTFTFQVPTSTLTSAEGMVNDLGLRFRLSTTPGLGPVDERNGEIPDGEVEDYLIPAETAVTLAGFSAANTAPGQITLEWITEEELDNFGFRVYRSKDGVFSNARYEGFVPSYHFDETRDEGSYTFVDMPHEAATYTYWLVAVDSGANYSMQEPITVVLPPFTTTFMPLIYR